MQNTEFVNRLKSVAVNYKTLYVMGGFGAPLTERNKNRYTANHEYNIQTERASKIKSATVDTFAFDCVGLIKGLLWGWCGETFATYGGAKYTSNNVPDKGANSMFRMCTDTSSDFSTVAVGEALHIDGHIGIYIGDGLAVECTPMWKDGVQITAVKNIGTREGYPARRWNKHGKLPFIEYPKTERKEETVMTTYTVKKGDNLWNIAKNILGDGARYVEIKALNKLTSDTIHVGQVLKLPVASASDPSETRYETLGRAFEKAMNDIKGVESVQTLLKMLGETK